MNGKIAIVPDGLLPELWDILGAGGSAVAGQPVLDCRGQWRGGVCRAAGVDGCAGGYYQDRSGDQQAFVASEHNGWWGKAIEVPGSGALNTGGFAQVMSVSCTWAGYCPAGGYYTNRSGADEAFVVSRLI